MNNRFYLFHILLFALIALITSGTAVHSYAADNPPSIAGEFDKGLAEYEAENYEEALGHFDKAYSDNPKDSRTALYLGLTHREMQDYSEAVRFFKEALSIDPSTPDTQFLLADVLYGTGSYEEALTAADAAISGNQHPAQSQFLKGQILLKLKRYNEAMEAFKQAKQLDPALTQQADFQTASIYMEEKDYGKAKETFKGLITVDPASDWAVFAKDYLEALDKMPKRYRLNIGFGYQFDDNALAIPLDSTLVPISKQKDWKRMYSLFGEYSVIETGPWNLKASYLLNIGQYNKSDYNRNDGGKVFSQDTVSHTVSLMPSYNTEKGVTSLLLSYNYLAVDYTKYMQSFLVNPSYTFIISGNHFGQVYARYRRDDEALDFFQTKFGNKPNQSDDRSADNFGGGLGYFYTFANGGGLFNVKVEAEGNSASGSNWDYTGIRGSIGLLYPLITNKLKANLFGDIYHQGFGNTDTTYLKKRDDNTYTVQASLTYTICRPLDITAGYSYIRDESNIGVYNYSRNLYTISLEYRF
ncbi:MAG: tetratricopeptide repeat protein [Nitrospirae bacterium]|nr:tetratricopeptide repeat protein [Nitrospirota bacterium]